MISYVKNDGTNLFTMTNDFEQIVTYEKLFIFVVPFLKLANMPF
jgi:hypothetical protein